MMKRILVNATQQEELRVAIVDGQRLYNLDIEATTKKQKKGNIYKGVISSVVPSLDAVFVDYGGAKHGFLPTKEICPKYFSSGSKAPAHKLIEKGQELIVQIVREELSSKGASLSAYVSLTGLYMVLFPDKPRTTGISQRISGEDRLRMIDISRQLVTEKSESIILRTACLNAEKSDLKKNLDYLRYLWGQIQKHFDERPAPFLIYKEANVVLQTIQNNLGMDISEIIIDNQEIYDETKEFLSMVLPDYKKKLKLYSGDTPLFNRMHLETQIESLYQHKINLPSGGAIVMDHTEALTTIDVNSARSTDHQGLEETALKTNLEAVDEIARQLRLRDLGGLLVIDFIDMMVYKNRRSIERHLQELLKQDRARTRLGSISDFGILEMSRQRLRTSLKDESEILCPRCSGRGFIRTVKSCALVVLRLIEEEAGKPKTEKIVGQVPAEVSKFLINEKNNELDGIEKRHKVRVSIISDSQIETPHYKIMRHKENNDNGYGKDQDSVSIRSSLHEPSLIGKQNEEAKKASDEVPAIPTLLVMKRRTLPEIFKNLWKKCTALFTSKKAPYKQNKRTRKPYRKQKRAYTPRKSGIFKNLWEKCTALFTSKKAPDKRTHKTYRKQKRAYTPRKSEKSSYRNRHKKTQASTSDKRRTDYKKPAHANINSHSNESTAKQPDYKEKEFSPLKNSLHSIRKRRQHQKPKTDHINNQHRSSSSYRHDDTINRTGEKTSLPSSHSSDKNNHPNSTPQTIKAAYRPGTILTQSQTGNKKSKLIQIETKAKTDNDSK